MTDGNSLLFRRIEHLPHDDDRPILIEIHCVFCAFVAVARNEKLIEAHKQPIIAQAFANSESNSSAKKERNDLWLRRGWRASRGRGGKLREP